MTVYLDPDPQDGGGGSPDPTSADASSSADGGGSPETSMSIDEVAAKVQESFGLRDGQRIDNMITGAADRAVRKMFGLEKGQNALDRIGSLVGDKITEAMKASETPASGDNGEDQKVIELRQDLDAVRKTANELATAKEEADKKATGERRRGLIRDSLAEFDIHPNLKNLVTRGFLHGVEADPQVSEDDDEVLVIAMKDGTTRTFNEYLKSYFAENKSFLSQERRTGSGARGGGGRPASSGSITDFKSSGKQLVKDYDKAAKENPEGALEGIQKKGRELAEKMGIPYAE